jgi:hypothetical protein
MVEDASVNYPGGLQKLELVKGDTGFAEALYRFYDERAAKRVETLAITERPPFMKVRLGTHPDNRALRQALLDAGNRIGDWGGDILKKVQVASKPTEVDIVVVSVAELGFPNGATRAQIYEKALSLGLGLLPAEVGPQMRLQYTDQPNGEWILVAMEPITDSDGSLYVVVVGHVSDGRWLDGSSGGPDDFWIGSCRWAFRCK